MNHGRQVKKAASHPQCWRWLLWMLLLIPSVVFAPPPAWWATRGATNSATPDDFSAANIGQLKHMASKGVEELNSYVPGGAGSALTGMIAGWRNPPQPGVTRDDFATVNLGQLKAVAKPVYDRLIAAGFATGYPWTATTADDDDFAIANLGQLKQVFSFDLTRDTDGDGIPDWWETKYGLNPDDPADANADADGDGWTNKQEWITGGNPKDAASGPSFPAAQVVGNGAEDERISKQVTVTLPAGNQAYIVVVAVQTAEYPDYTSDQSEFNDMADWNISPAGGTATQGSVNVNALHGDFQQSEQAGTSLLGLAPYALVATGTVQANPTSPTQVQIEVGATNISDSALPTTVIAALLPVDLDIVHPYGGELDERKQHDPSQSGLVAVKRGDFTKPEGARDEPVTKLVIRANTSMQGLKWKLRFNGGTDFKLWKDVERTQSVVSDQTEFDPAQDVALFFEGLKKSGAVGSESVKLLVVINGNSIEADTIYFTVVEAQILVQVRFWIREGWIPLPWHPTANPLLNKIAGGDRRDNSLDWEPGLGTPPLSAAPGYRVAQEAVLQPFQELNPGLYSGQRAGSASNKSGVSSIFYKPSSVPSPSLAYSATNELLATATPSSIAAPSTSRMHIDSSRTNDRTATIRFYGAVNDPLVLGSFDIDWDLNVSIDATDPLNLKYAIDGAHDDYPAVEVNMKLDAKDPAPTIMPFTTSPHPYFWLHPFSSNVFDLGNGSAITISPPKRGDVK